MSHPLTRRSFAKAMGFSLAGSGWASSWGCLPESPPSPAPSGAGTLSMTTGPPDVAIPPDQPADEIWRYGLTFPFQISSDTAAIFCNLRGQSGHDFEIGTDVFLFQNLSGLQEREAIPISRNHEETNPHSDPPGRPAIMVKYPVRGGFVPLGALLEDGSPHPHAGTGFGCSQVIAWTPDRKGEYPQDQREDYMEVYDLAYDGRRFEVTETARLTFGRLLDGAVLSNPGITTAIPDGEDLLFAMGGQIEQARGSGLTRWRRGQEGLRPVSWTPITGPDNAFEPSVVRDRDDKLLFCARGGRAPDYNDVRVWQSTGADAPWKKVIHVRGVVSHGSHRHQHEPQRRSLCGLQPVQRPGGNRWFPGTVTPETSRGTRVWADGSGSAWRSGRWTRNGGGWRRLSWCAIAPAISGRLRRASLGEWTTLPPIPCAWPTGSGMTSSACGSAIWERCFGERTRLPIRAPIWRRF